MKQFLILFLMIGILYANSSAQVAINNDGSQPNASAGLDVKFTDKGLLPPRMTTSQINAISSPASGLMAFNTESNSPLYYNGSAWRSFGGNYASEVGFRSESSLSNTVYSWTVPAAVTKLLVECWGGGGGGASGGGGGGGGYAATEWTVAPGTTVNITVGAAGAAATSNTTDGTDGNSSIVVINAIQLIAYGGDGGHTSQPGIPGRFSANSTVIYPFGQSGTAGESNCETYGQYSATVYYTAVQFGGGGEGGNSMLTQKNGGFRSYNTSTLAQLKNIYSQVGAEPGGGGGGDYYGGKQGGPGLIIIHY
jgi:hypothetical protein